MAALARRAGGLIGWVASMIVKTDGRQGVFRNVVVGIAGAMLGGWFISSMVPVSPRFDRLSSVRAAGHRALPGIWLA